MYKPVLDATHYGQRSERKSRDVATALRSAALGVDANLDAAWMVVRSENVNPIIGCITFESLGFSWGKEKMEGLLPAYVLGRPHRQPRGTHARMPGRPRL